MLDAPWLRRVVEDDCDQIKTLLENELMIKRHSKLTVENLLQ